MEIRQFALSFVQIEQTSFNYKGSRNSARGGGQGGPDPLLHSPQKGGYPPTTQKGGYPPFVGKVNTNIFHILLSFQLK